MLYIETVFFLFKQRGLGFAVCFLIRHFEIFVSHGLPGYFTSSE